MPEDTILFSIGLLYRSCGDRAVFMYKAIKVVLGVKVKAMLMDEAGLRRALMRISHEILEKNQGINDIVIVGVRRRGAELANRIAQNIKSIEGTDIPCGDIDISFYRDDLTKVGDSPVVSEAGLDFSVVGKKVILVDDVLYTGRTARAAIEAVFSMGRPKSIQLAILIDRGHRELPIRADYVGKSVPTSHTELVSVMIPPYDEETAVMLLDI